MLNGFVIKDESDNHYILLFLNDIIINQINTEPFYISNKYPSYINSTKLKHHIIKFHHTNLQFEYKEDIDIYGLFISFIYSKNSIAITILYKLIVNIYNKNNINKNENINDDDNKNNNKKLLYNDTIQYFLKKEKIDIPYHMTLDDLYEEIDKSLYDNNIMIDDELNIFVLQISKIITDAKPKYDEYNDDKYINLNKYLKEVRSINNNQVQIGGYNQDYIDIYNTIFDSNKKNYILNLGNIFIKHRNFYYENMIRNKVNQIREDYKKNNIHDKILENRNILLKIIEPLDPYLIYNFTEKRSLSQLLFEI